MNDYEELQKIYDNIGAKQFESKLEKVSPLFGGSVGYSGNIAIWLNAGLQALDRTRNMLLVVIILFFIGTKI